MRIDASLPEQWLKTTVGEVFEIVGGGTPPTNRPEFWDGDISWITSADIDDNHQIQPRKKITKAAIESSATNLVPPGSVIVVTRVGLGKVGIAKEPLCFSQDSQALLFNSEHFNPKFVTYYMSRAVSAFQRIGRGTTISGVTKQQLRETDFLLVPTAEQHRIVAEIDKQFVRLEECKDALRRVAEDLKQYRASVLKAACEGRLVPTEAEIARAEGHDFEPASALLERILAERRVCWEAAQLAQMKVQGKVPKDDRWKEKYVEPEEPGSTVLLQELEEGWAFATIDQISTRCQYGTSAKTRSEPDGVPIIRMGNIVDGKIESNVLKYLPSSHHEFPELLLDPGDLLFNRTNSAELVGKTAVYKGSPSPCSFASYLIRLSFIEGVVPEFINFFLNSIYGRAWIASVVSQQVGQANVNGTKLRALVIPLPPFIEQRRIVDDVERRLQIVDELEELVSVNLERADELRRAILKRAFEGRLVPQDPADEPAAALLERIAAERHAEAPMTQKKSPFDKRRKKSPETEPSTPLFTDDDVATQPKELLTAFTANERLTVEDLFRHGSYRFDSEVDIDRFFEKLTAELEAARLTLERTDNDEVFVKRSGV